MSFEIITVIVVGTIFGVLMMIANRAEKVVAENYKRMRLAQNTLSSTQATSKKKSKLSKS